MVMPETEWDALNQVSQLVCLFDCVIKHYTHSENAGDEVRQLVSNRKS